MKRVICLLLGVCLVPATIRAEEKKGCLTDPIEILKKVDAACKAVKAVKYDVTFESTGTPQAPGMKLKGSVIAAGKVINRQPEMYVIDIETSSPDSEEVRRITSGSDGEMFYVVDHQAKKAYEDIDPAVIGASRRFLRLVAMIEFLHSTPFSDEISGKSREMRGCKEINGVECYEIQVVYTAEGAPLTTWYFGKKDFLPRARIDQFTTPTGEKMTWKKMLSNLVTDPKLDKEAFKLKLPEGYAKTDDFAP